MYKQGSATLLVGLWLFCGVFAQSAWAKTLYVAPNGNDANSGGLTSPLATPNRALSLAAPGDTISLRGGRYQLGKTLYLDKANLTLTSYPNETAVLIATTADAANLGNVVYIVANRVTLQGLEIQGGHYYGLKVEANLGTVVRNCRILGSGRDNIKMSNADEMLIEGCDIGPSGLRDSSNAEGIDSVGGRATVVRGCYIHDTATAGLYLKGGAADCVVENNRVERTGAAGILMGQDTDPEFMRNGTPYEALNCIVRNNIVTQTAGAGVGAYSGSNIWFENNTLYDVARTYHAGLYVVSNTRHVASRLILFKNNIVVMNSTRPIFFVINLADALQSDYNLFFKPSGVYGFWRESAAATNYWPSLKQWQLGLKVDQHSTINDPQLLPAMNYKPAPGSPAIDCGETLADVPRDFAGILRPQGRAYDIGAHEFPVTQPQKPPVQSRPPRPPKQRARN